MNNYAAAFDAWTTIGNCPASLCLTPYLWLALVRLAYRQKTGQLGVNYRADLYTDAMEDDFFQVLQAGGFAIQGLNPATSPSSLDTLAAALCVQTSDLQTCLQNDIDNNTLGLNVGLLSQAGGGLPASAYVGEYILPAHVAVTTGEAMHDMPVDMFAPPTTAVPFFPDSNLKPMLPTAVIAVAVPGSPKSDISSNNSSTPPITQVQDPGADGPPQESSGAGFLLLLLGGVVAVKLLSPPRQRHLERDED